MKKRRKKGLIFEIEIDSERHFLTTCQFVNSQNTLISIWDIDLLPKIYLILYNSLENWTTHTTLFYKYVVRSSTGMAKKALPLMTTPSYLQPRFCQCLHASIWQDRKNMQMKEQKKRENE